MQWRDITAVGPTKKHKLSLGHYLFISVIDNILKYFSPQGLRKALYFPKLPGATVATKHLITVYKTRIRSVIH